MSEQLVTVEKSEAGYAVVTLNRPNAMNALSSALCSQFADAVAQLEADPAIRVLIVTGAGRAFCAGLDLKELGSGSGDRVTSFISNSDPVRALGRFSGPIIGAINGVAITGGFELALACDVLLASTEARFADTHARVGIIPGWGLSQKLSRLVGPSRAKEISFAGNFIPAQQAERIGLVNRVVEPGELLDQARQLALDMLSALPEILPVYKKLIDDGYALSYGEAMALEQEQTAAWSRSVTPDQIAQRRQNVQERGRAQQKKD
jgi:enoyl-CoA hydratase